MRQVCAVLYTSELVRNLEVCPKCDNHMRVSGRKRLDYFFDADSFVEIGAEVHAVDKLKFRDLKNIKTGSQPLKKPLVKQKL